LDDSYHKGNIRKEWNNNWNSCLISPNEDGTFTIILKDSLSEFSIQNVNMISDITKINASSDLYAKMNKAYEIQQKRLKSLTNTAKNSLKEIRK